MKCTRKVVDCGMLLSANNISEEEKKNNLKNIIYNHIEGNYADFDPSIEIDLTMLEIIKGIEKVPMRETDHEYVKDIFHAIVIGMEMIQNNHIHITREIRKKNYIEPVFSYNGDGDLISITVITKPFMYKSLTQVSKHFDNKFMKDRNIRTLKK